MAIMASVTTDQVLNTARSLLAAHRRSLLDVQQYALWTAGISAADLQAIATGTGAPMSSADAGIILAAMADANAEAQIHFTGQAPGTYPQVTGTPYIYAASQVRLIGPFAG